MAERSILALDLGTNLGWAIYHKGQIVSGTYKLKRNGWEGAGMRYLRFRNEFLRKFRGIHQVYYEEVRRHEGTDAAHVFGALMGTLCSWCEEYQIPYGGVPVGKIKKFATGKGNANKLLVIDAMKAQGFNPQDDNEADALALLAYARKHREAV